MASGNGGHGGEGEALKAIFTNVRNPHSHGGSNPPTDLGNRKLHDVDQELGAAAVLIAFPQKRGKEQVRRRGP